MRIQGTFSHAKNQENHNLNEKRQAADDNTDHNQVLELSDKDSKAALIKILQQAKINTVETNEKIASLTKEGIKEN